MPRPNLSALLSKFVFEEALDSNDKAALREDIGAETAGAAATAIAVSVNLTGNQTIAGQKTFSSPIKMGIMTFDVGGLIDPQTVSFPDNSGEVWLDNSFGTVGLTVAGSATAGDARDTLGLGTAAAIATLLGLPTYADLTAANTALGIGKIYYDTALATLNVTTA